MTGDDLAWLRAELGASEPPSDLDLSEAFNRLGSREAVALEVVRGRLAKWTEGPASINVGGEYSQNVGANITHLEKQEKRLQDATGTVTVTRPLRTGWPR